KVLTYILGVLLIFLFIHWVQLGFPDTRFKSIFQNPNYLAVLLFVMLYFKLLTITYGNVIDKVYVLTLILLNFILIYSTNTRSVLLAAVVILVSWIVMKGFQRVFPYLFHITIIANVFFIFFYVMLQNTRVGLFLNNLSMQLLGKNLYSGRAELWNETIKAAMN